MMSLECRGTHHLIRQDKQCVPGITELKELVLEMEDEAMGRILFVLMCLLLLTASGCLTATYVLNQPKVAPLPRPLDLEHIFSSERVRPEMSEYVGDKVIFLADISTSKEKHFEAFLADRTGSNPVRLSVGGAVRIGTAFQDGKIVVLRETGEYISRPFVLSVYDQFGREVSVIQDVHDICVSPDKSKIALIKTIPGADSGSGPFYSLYTMGDNLQLEKIADLPPQVGSKKRHFLVESWEYFYGHYWGGRKERDLIDYKALEWQPDGIRLMTEELTYVMGPNYPYTFRTYMLLIPGGQSWTLIEEKEVVL